MVITAGRSCQEGLCSPASSGRSSQTRSLERGWRYDPVRSVPMTRGALALGVSMCVRKRPTPRTLRSRRSRPRSPAPTHVAYVDVADVAGWIAPSARDALRRRARPRTILGTLRRQRKRVKRPRSIHAFVRCLFRRQQWFRGGPGLTPTRSQTSCPAMDLNGTMGGAASVRRASPRPIPQLLQKFASPAVDRVATRTLHRQLDAARITEASARWITVPARGNAAAVLRA